MVGKLKNILRITLILWVLFFGYFYEITDTRSLFEYIGFLLVGLYISFDIKSDLKYLLILALTWNVVDETAMIFGNESFKLLALIPVVVWFLKLGWKKATNYELTNLNYEI